MTQMLTVPAEVVVQLRGALLEELGRPATEIAYAGVLSDRFEHLERITDPLQRFDRHRALLDAIGWQQTAETVDIDLSAHRWALLACLERLLAVERDLAKAPSHPEDTDQYWQAESNARAIERFLDGLKGRTA